MCIRETRHWGCSCRPMVFYQSCSENKTRDIELCPNYEIHASYPNVQCNDCDSTVWPTPPSSPGRISIRELKSVFESPKARDAKRETDGARGTRHRRDSVGKLEDKCTECRNLGLTCDMKQPHCTSCLRNGTICETAKEWAVRVGGHTASRDSPRPDLIDMTAPVPTSSPRRIRPRARVDTNTWLKAQELSNGGITNTQPLERDYSAAHRSTDASLEDLKKNMRGLKAIMNMHGAGIKRDPRELVISIPEPVTMVHDLSMLPGFMTFPSEEKEEVAWVEPRFDNPEPVIMGERQLDECISPLTRITKLDEPYSFSSEEESLLSSGESDIFSPSSEIFGDERPSEMPSLEPDPGLPTSHPEDENQVQNSLEGLNTTSGKVRTAAEHAYRKLNTVARSKKASIAFRHFVESLGSLDNILRIGSQTFEMLVDQETPKSLIQIYCFLHFAYAMSQGDTDLLPSSEKEFQRGLEVFRSCLSSTPEYEGAPSQRDIFDEIADHMAHELECALRWAKKQNLTPTSFQGLSLEDVLRLHSERGDASKRMNSIQTAVSFQVANATDVILRIAHQTPLSGTTSWRDIRSLRVFNGVAGFLSDFGIGLSRFGSPFKIFTGEFCKSISSEIYKHPVYSKGFRQHHHHLLDADRELRNSIQTEIVSKFDHRLIAHDSLLHALQTSLEMFDFGSLLTLEDYVGYARGLVRTAVLPIYLATQFEDEIISRSQKLIQKLPSYLLGRVQWPEFLNTPVTILTPASSSHEPQQYDGPMDTSYISLGSDYVVNIAQPVPQPDVAMILDQFYPSDTIDKAYVNPEPQISLDHDLSPYNYNPTEPMDFEPCSTPGSSQPASCSPQTSVTSSTPPPLSATSCSSEDVESPSSTSSTSTPTSATFMCAKCRKTFTNKSNLSRHERTKHSSAAAAHKKMLRCPIAGCKTMLGSARAKENMRTHLKKKHGVERPGIEEVRWRVDVSGNF
ncbi:hypothetical protein ABW21_db0201073 [Orbilia brochopaga]|nr:hypothetical protein ABW21_db0201073 [Drechslerella brochopaga]